MKVLFLITSLRGGGAERVMSILVNHFVHSDIEPHLVLFDRGEGFYSVDPKVQVFVLTKKKLFDNKIGTFIQQIQLFFALVKLIQKNKYACLVSFTTYVNAITIVLGKLLNTFTIISERNDPKNHAIGFANSLFRKLTYKYATAIVLQTKASINSFVFKRIKLPLAKEIIWNPIGSNFSESETVERKNVILSVGRLSYEKGHDILIEAFANSQLDWELWIIGKGPNLDKLIELAASLHVSNKVKFLGMQSNVSQFYQQAKVFVLPSRTEGFPNVLCEAMISGCACISFDCPNGPAEIITNGENGILVENGNAMALANAIQKLCADESNIFELGSNAKELKNRLNIDAIGKQWEDFILKINTKKNR